MLFERATFLVISHAMLSTHYDVHRFEKVSITIAVVCVCVFVCVCGGGYTSSSSLTHPPITLGQSGLKHREAIQAISLQDTGSI